MGTTTHPEPDFRDTISTVDADGKRKWVYPKQPSGRFYNWRTYLSYFLLIVLFGLPWIKVGGEPFIMLNVIQRKFILFGLAFSPQDFHLFAILMITGVVFIILFTVVFGRLFCGWVCPQTIFMEMVFRKIEYWIEGNANAQRKLNKAPWTFSKVRKKVTKQFLFICIATLIAHTFLAYIIGIDEVLLTVSQSPLEAPSGFITIIIFIGVFYFVFANMREQVCIAICPYGRLQGVLLDENSINVIYDYNRGEPRGKIRKGQPKKSSCTDCADCRTGKASCSDQILHRIERAIANDKPAVREGEKTVSLAETSKSPLLNIQNTSVKGDCIDCKLCVQVCPTGIDIRNGVQMECVNCTACIDACDEVMDKIKKPRGLIRYDSENGVLKGKRKIWTTRVIAYSSVLVGLILLNVFLLGSRSGVEVLLLRTPGTLYQTNADGSINNLYTYQLVNNTGDELRLDFSIVNIPKAKVRFVGANPVASPREVTEGVLFLDLPAQVPSTFDGLVELEVYQGGELMETIETSFIHPENQ